MTAPVPIPAAPPHEYATHIPNRRPQFKTHKTLGQAKSAVIQKMHDGARDDMTIYRLQDGEYRLWLHVLAGQKRDEVPELAPKPPPRSHVVMEIRSLVEQEQYHLWRRHSEEPSCMAALVPPLQAVRHPARVLSACCPLERSLCAARKPGGG